MDEKFAILFRNMKSADGLALAHRMYDKYKRTPFSAGGDNARPTPEGNQSGPAVCTSCARRHWGGCKAPECPSCLLHHFRGERCDDARKRFQSAGVEVNVFLSQEEKTMALISGVKPAAGVELASSIFENMLKRDAEDTLEKEGYGSRKKAKKK